MSLKNVLLALSVYGNAKGIAHDRCANFRLGLKIQNTANLKLHRALLAGVG